MTEIGAECVFTLRNSCTVGGGHVRVVCRVVSTYTTVV